MAMQLLLLVMVITVMVAFSGGFSSNDDGDDDDDCDDDNYYDDDDEKYKVFKKSWKSQLYLDLSHRQRSAHQTGSRLKRLGMAFLFAWSVFQVHS
ncbi:hypothetical protein PoB_001678900 [Plakobranchus ocellatus]|uniref:Uncharacterized protein n=1 Tax=Plakobranchus ocellatus TaxID=259542 RepID=A0AAV3Z4R0_9GAST|nr:hypothetical protein PoB_001678900 [Plakobranchus ocellatus]